MHVLRYLKDTLQQVLCFPVVGNLHLTAYCDSE